MFVGNPIRGDAPFFLGGDIFTLRYDWDALAIMGHHVGSDVNLFDPDTLASVLSIGMSKQHPGMTPAAIFDASPPMAAAVNDVNRALQYCYFGHRQPPEDQENSGNARKQERLDQIAQAYTTAFRVGISPVDFWSMTPFQTNILVQAHAETLKDEFETLLSIGWHTALFQRCKTMPPLKSLMRNHHDPTVVRDDDDEEQVRAKAMMAAFMGATKVKSITTQAFQPDEQTS